MDFPRHRILVVGDDSRSALAIVRSLWRAGAHVSLASESAESIVRESCAVARIFDLPSSAASISAWGRALKKVIREYEFDAIIPANETAWLGLIQMKQELPKSAVRFLPRDSAFESVYHKSKTFELARSLSIPVPESHMFASESDALSFFKNRKSNTPYIGKPDVSKIWSGEYRIDLGVEVLKGEEDVRSFLRSTLPFAPVLIQERVPGVGIGQEFLACDGEIILSFQHERIHEPLGSGGSSYRKSVPMHTRMLECSRKLLSALKWNGACMVEYRWDSKTDQFWFMEINGRFWGSLPLAIGAGADFPAALISSELDGIKPSIVSYRIGLLARNLIKDFHWVFKTQGFLGVCKEGVIALFRFLSGQEIWDTFSWSDPQPFFTEIAYYAKKAFRLAFFSISRLLVRPFYVLFGGYIEKRRIVRILSLIRKNPTVLFVCYGNIARSPFAERFARKIFSEKGLKEFSFSSRGYYPESGRAPGVLTAIAAGEFGVSLDDHRSKVVSKKDVETAGVIFCMDRANYHALKTQFSSVTKKLFFLGGFGPSREISDPWMKSYKTIQESFTRIERTLVYFCDFVKTHPM